MSRLRKLLEPEMVVALLLRQMGGTARISSQELIEFDPRRTELSCLRDPRTGEWCLSVSDAPAKPYHPAEEEN